MKELDFKTNIGLSLDDNKVKLKLYDDKYDIIVENGNIYAVKKKLVYPQNYNECCSILGFNSKFDLNHITTHDVVYDYKMQNLYRVLICRDAYWKIVGDWKPNYTNTLSNDVKYVIEVNKGILTKSTCADVSKILVFPTSEMRDVFLENFRGLIEACKEFI